MKYFRSLIITFLLLLFAFIFPMTAIALDPCVDFEENFNGAADHIWSPAYGTWSIQDQALHVDQIPDSTMASYATGFQANDFFVADVNILTLTGEHPDAAAGLYIYGSGDVFFDIDDKAVSGAGAIVFSNLGIARLLAWDVPSQQWYQSTDLILPELPESVGVAYSSDAVTLRLDKQNTELKLTGTFDYAATVLDTLWLFAQQAGTTAIFDNVCAGSLNDTPPETYQLMVSKSGTGSGGVYSFPAGIQCGEKCTNDYPASTQIILTPGSKNGSIFSGWSGGGCSGLGDCVVTLNSDAVVNAEFTAVEALSQMPTPDGAKIFEYGIIDQPVLSEDLEKAKPIGLGEVANWGDSLNFQIGLLPFEEPTDIYLGFYAPALDPNNLYLVTPNNLFVSYAQAGLVAWKTNVVKSIDAHIFKDIPTDILLPGRYYFYLLAIPKHRQNSSYFWSTALDINPSDSDILIRLIGLGQSHFISNQPQARFTGIAKSSDGIAQITFLNESNGIHGVATDTNSWQADVQLQEGDNRVSFFAYSGNGTMAKISTIVTYNTRSYFTAPLQISDEFVYVDDPKTVNFSIGTDGLSDATVKLLRTDGLGQVTDLVGLCQDNGQQPDETAGDGVFSASETIKTTESGFRCYRMGVSLTSGNNIYSEERCIRIAEHYTDDDIQNAVDLSTQATDLYEAAKANGKSISEASLSVFEGLKNMPGIGVIDISPNGIIGWVTDKGILGGFHAEAYEQEQIENRSESSEANAPNRSHAHELQNQFQRVTRGADLTIGNNKAVLISPCIDDMKKNDHFYTVWPNLKNANSCRLTAANEITGNAVTLETFKNLSDYGYIHIHTHGDVAYFTSHFKTIVWGKGYWVKTMKWGGGDNYLGLFEVRHPSLDTHIALNKSKNGTYDISGFEDDFHAHRIGIFKGTIYILPSFINKYVDNLPDSFVHLSACFSMNTSRMADAFEAAGASAVVGYKLSANSRLETIPVANTIIEKLLDGQTIKEAVFEGKKISKAASDLLLWEPKTLPEHTLVSCSEYPLFYEGAGSYVASSACVDCPCNDDQPKIEFQCPGNPKYQITINADKTITFGVCVNVNAPWIDPYSCEIPACEDIPLEERGLWTNISRWVLNNQMEILPDKSFTIRFDQPTSSNKVLIEGKYDENHAEGTCTTESAPGGIGIDTSWSGSFNIQRVDNLSKCDEK